MTNSNSTNTTSDTARRLLWVLPLVLGIGVASAAAGPALMFAARRRSGGPS